MKLTPRTTLIAGLGINVTGNSLIDVDDAVVELVDNKDQPLGYVGLDVNSAVHAKLVGRFGTAAAINAIQLEEGEYASTTDTFDFRIGDGVTPGGRSVTLNSLSTVVVNALGTPTDNGDAFLAAYAVAETLSPNGSSLSAINRATILVGPGRYGAFPTMIASSYIDLVGIGGSQAGPVIVSPATPNIRCKDHRLIGFTFYRVTMTLVTHNAGTEWVTAHHEDLFYDAATSATNVHTLAGIATVPLTGTFRNCRTNGASMYGGSGGANGSFYGVFEFCEGGDKSLMGNATANGGTNYGIIRYCKLLGASWTMKNAGVVHDCDIAAPIVRLVAGGQWFNNYFHPASGQCLANNAVAVDIKAAHNRFKTFAAATPFGTGVTNFGVTPVIDAFGNVWSDLL